MLHGNVNGSKWIRIETRLALYICDGFECGWCGKDLSRTSHKNIHIDHVVPRHKGGTNKSSNLVTSCKRCNERKNGFDASIMGEEAILRVLTKLTTRPPLNRKLTRELASMLAEERLRAAVKLSRAQ